jgi:hypothetical protein
MSLLSGPSGTADMFMKVAEYFSFTKEEKILLRAAVTSWMVTKNHSTSFRYQSNIFCFNLFVHCFFFWNC